MAYSIDPRSQLVKDAKGDLVIRDLFSRNRVQTVTGNLLRNDYYHTDGINPPTMLAGEYVSYDALSGLGSYHIFAKPEGNAQVDTTATTNATISVDPLKTTIRSLETEIASLNVLGNSTVNTMTATDLTVTSQTILGYTQMTIGTTLTADDVVIGGHLGVYTDALITGNATLNVVTANALTVNGDATVSGQLQAGPATLGSINADGLNAIGPIVTQSFVSSATLNVSGIATVGNDLSVDGNIMMGATDGDFARVERTAIAFSDKWRIYYDAANDELLIQQRASAADPWQTKFTFTATP